MLRLRPFDRNRRAREAELVERGANGDALPSSSTADSDTCLSGTVEHNSDESHGDYSGALPPGLREIPYSVLVGRALIFLEAKDLVQAGCVCRAFQQACDDPRLWQRLLFLDFSGPRLKGDAFLQYAAMLRDGGPSQEAMRDSQTENEEQQHGHTANPLIVDQNTGSGASTSIPIHSGAVVIPQVEDGNATLDAGGDRVAAFCSNPLYQGPSAGSGSERSLNPKQIWLHGTELGPQDLAAKQLYLGRVHEFEERIRKAEMLQSINEEIKRVLKRRRRIEWWVRLYNLHFITPLLTLCPLATLIFAAATLDGWASFSAWAVLSPLLFLFSALLVSIIIGMVLVKYRSRSSSILFWLYYNMRGFVQFWMHVVFREHPRALASGLVLFLAFMLFILLIGVRLADSASRLPWAGVFAPFWFALAIFAASPVLKWGAEWGSDQEFDRVESYKFFMVLIWLPLLAFSILLCLYLDAVLNTELVLVMIPLFISQAASVAIPLSAMAVSLYRREDVVESTGTLFLCVLIFGPITAFEIMLAAKVDSDANLSYGQVILPLAIWISSLFLLNLGCLLQKEPNGPVELSSAHPLVLKKLSLSRSVSMASPSSNSDNRPQLSRSTAASFLNIRRANFDNPSYHRHARRVPWSLGSDSAQNSTGSGSGESFAAAAAAATASAAAAAAAVTNINFDVNTLTVAESSPAATSSNSEDNAPEDATENATDAIGESDAVAQDRQTGTMSMV